MKGTKTIYNIKKKIMVTIRIKKLIFRAMICMSGGDILQVRLLGCLVRLLRWKVFVDENNKQADSVVMTIGDDNRATDGWLSVCHAPTNSQLLSLTKNNYIPPVKLNTAKLINKLFRQVSLE